MEGMILKIDRNSRHDGPGLRTVVFLKGCPLRCLWCSTPDSQQLRPERLRTETLCTLCGRCAAACPEHALRLEAGDVVSDQTLCRACGRCAEVCLNRAVRISGTRMTLDAVFDVINRSRGFWNRMPGGVTVSGGEALFQYDFTLALLQRCHDAGIDTNVETSCFAPPEKIAALLPHLDHLCCDIKHMDDETHKRLTGVSNTLILDNIRMVSREKDLILRYPIIPTCNDDDANVDAVAAFALGLGRGFNRIDLLPYHQMGAITYRRLGRDYALDGVEPLPDARMIAIRDRLIARGVRAVLA